jgi:hypothetical protein
MGAPDNDLAVAPAAPRRTPSKPKGLTFDEELLDLLAAVGAGGHHLVLSG